MCLQASIYCRWILKDKSSCCLVENGKQKLSVEQIMKISEYFGFTLDQFVKQNLSKEMDAYDKENAD